MLYTAQRSLYIRIRHIEEACHGQIYFFSPLTFSISVYKEPYYLLWALWLKVHLHIRHISYFLQTCRNRNDVYYVDFQAISNMRPIALHDTQYTICPTLAIHQKPSMEHGNQQRKKLTVNRNSLYKTKLCVYVCVCLWEGVYLLVFKVFLQNIVNVRNNWPIH